MGITEEEKQARHKSSERVSRGTTDQSSARGTEERVTNVEPQDRVDQVREILFGAQREEYDRRFSRLEELLVKSISDLSNDTTEKFGALRDDYDKRLARLEGLLVKNIQEVQHEKVDKTAISKLLKQILKLSHDLDVAELEDTSDE